MPHLQSPAQFAAPRVRADSAVTDDAKAGHSGAGAAGKTEAAGAEPARA